MPRKIGIVLAAILAAGGGAVMTPHSMAQAVQPADRNFDVTDLTSVGGSANNIIVLFERATSASGRAAGPRVQSSEDIAGTLFGGLIVRGFAAAGIRFDVASREFRDRSQSYLPLVEISYYPPEGNSWDDIVVSTRRVLRDGEEEDCSDGCRAGLALIRVHDGRPSPARRIGLFDSGGYGIVGRVHWLGQSGQTYLLGVHVAQVDGGPEGWWDRATLVVVGPAGVVASDIPLARNLSAHVSASGPLLSRRVRLEGDRLTILYPGMQPAQAVFRIGPTRLDLIEGRIPAQLTRDN
jgi:hypothetical protein